MNLRNAPDNKMSLKNLAGRKMHRESNLLRNLRVSQTNTAGDISTTNQHQKSEGVLFQSNSVSQLKNQQNPNTAYADVSTNQGNRKAPQTAEIQTSAFIRIDSNEDSLVNMRQKTPNDPKKSIENGSKQLLGSPTRAVGNSLVRNEGLSVIQSKLTSIHSPSAASNEDNSYNV